MKKSKMTGWWKLSRKLTDDEWEEICNRRRIGESIENILDSLGGSEVIV